MVRNFELLVDWWTLLRTAFRTILQNSADNRMVGRLTAEMVKGDPRGYHKCKRAKECNRW